jgi:glucosamine-6-phosphate deaminase
MHIAIMEDKESLGKHAAQIGAAAIRDAIKIQGRARIIVATGASQFSLLEHLVGEDVAWEHVDAFHLDEYVGLEASHPASFRRFLKERFVDKLPTLGSFTYVDPAPSAFAELKRLVMENPIDVAFIGIGENGHLAFNDPPCDISTTEPYLEVSLDERCRLQQVGEGWFPSLEAVPATAITMSMHQILETRLLVCTVSDERKAEAVEKTLRMPIGPDVPSTYLRHHPNCHLLCDRLAFSRLFSY